MENNRGRIAIVVSMLSGALGGIITTVTALLVVKWYINFSFISDTVCSNAVCVKSHGGYALYFVDKDWNSEKYLSLVTNFYSTIITVLIGLLAIVVALVYYGIKGATLEKFEETATKEMERYFEKGSSLFHVGNPIIPHFKSHQFLRQTKVNS